MKLCKGPQPQPRRTEPEAPGVRSREWYAERVSDFADRRGRQPAPGTFEGRGIVTLGGGRYFACAYVLVRLLRHLGCDLPILCYHMGPDEMPSERAEILGEYDVETRDVMPHMEQHEDCDGSGWAAKAFAIAHAPFRHVLWLDADNVPTRDPSFLLDSEQYAEHGAIFWPDHAHPPDPEAYDMMGLSPRDLCLESGQMVIDKGRRWDALQLAWWMNRHSRFWYDHTYGDKDTFGLAWRRMGYDWAGPEVKGQYKNVILQYDFEGRVLFQHRCGHKWRITSNQRYLPALEHEALCHGFLAELRHEEAESMPQAPNVLQKAIRKGRPNRPLVCGVPRSGTTWMQNIMNRFQGVFCGQELNLWGVESLHSEQTGQLKPPLVGWVRGVFQRIVERHETLEDDPDAPPVMTPRLRAFARALREGRETAAGWFSRARPSRRAILLQFEDTFLKDGWDVVGDKVPAYAFGLRRLVEACDIDYVVVCLRDPLEVAVSWHRLDWNGAETPQEAVRTVTTLSHEMADQVEWLEGSDVDHVLAYYDDWSTGHGITGTLERLSDLVGRPAEQARGFVKDHVNPSNPYEACRDLWAAAQSHLSEEERAQFKRARHRMLRGESVDERAVTCRQT